MLHKAHLSQFCAPRTSWPSRLNNWSLLLSNLQVKPTFSLQEMQRRLHMIRHHMEANEIDACVFTSYHNVHYFSDFLYCYFGRPYAFIVTANKAMSVSAGKDVLNTFGTCLGTENAVKFKNLWSVHTMMQGRQFFHGRPGRVTSSRVFAWRGTIATKFDLKF